MKFAAGLVGAVLAVVAFPETATAVSPQEARQGWISWDLKNGTAQVHELDGLRLITQTKAGEFDSVIGVLQISSPDGATVELVGKEAPPHSRYAQFRAVRLERDAAAPVVLFRSFTGGAHCCLSYQLARLGPDGWRVSNLGAWDNSAAPEPVDVDGDGRLELVGRDQRFQYAFTSYAESVPPARVYEIIGEQLVDISAQPRFRELFEREFAFLKRGCLQDRARGYCASFAATAARLGRSDEAWPILDAAIPRNGATDSAPIPCATREPLRRDFPSFREAVRWYLGQLGYLSGAAIKCPAAQ